MKKLQYLVIVLPFLLLYFLFSIHSAYAYLICDTDRCGGYPVCATGCSDPDPGICDLGDNGGQCDLCGGNNTDCCRGGTAWTRYNAQCVQIAGNCDWVWKYGSDQCSTGDKCLNAGDTTLRWGDCNCANYGSQPYKTCCDANGSLNACARYDADGVYPMEGDCPNKTVICNRANCGALGNLPPNYTCTSAPCGQSACDTLAPPMTVTVHTRDVTTNAALANVDVVISDNRRGTQTTVTTNGSGDASNNTIVHLGDSFTLTPNNASNNEPCNQGYICGNSWNPNSPNPYTAGGNGGGSGCSINNGNHTIDCTINYTPGTISGHVYEDYNHNGVYDASDDGTPANIAVTANGKTGYTQADGSYTINYVSQGTWPVTFSMPAGNYVVVGSASQNVTVGPPATGVNFFYTPTYTISGRVYNDIDKNQYFNNGGSDVLYAGSGSVSLSGPTSISPMDLSGGTFTSGAQLESGTYTLTYSPPTGYEMTYPIPPSMSVTIGKQNPLTSLCNTNNVHDAQCDASGNISDADFGITNEFVWFQGYCSDLRNDSGFVDTIPSSAACGCADGAVATCQSASTCSNPGIVFSGNSSYDFGNGQANVNNWVVGGTTNPENFTPVNNTIIRSSYEYLSAVATQNAITPTAITTVPGCAVLNNCSPNITQSGVYIANGAMTLNSLTVPADTHIVLLVNGDLTIKGDITTPIGSTLTISSSRDIIVDPTVGVASINTTTSNLEGFFSADRTFWIKTAYTAGNHCNIDGSSKDLRVNIAGSVVVNAYHLGGTFQNDRDLCLGDLTCPIDVITFRPDFILNAPAFIKHKNAAWQELAP